jgi:hypothetical protein
MFTRYICELTVSSLNSFRGSWNRVIFHLVTHFEECSSAYCDSSREFVLSGTFPYFTCHGFNQLCHNGTEPCPDEACLFSSVLDWYQRLSISNRLVLVWAFNSVGRFWNLGRFCGLWSRGFKCFLEPALESNQELITFQI